MANKAYKFRIYPNAEQQVLFAKTFGCVRFIYNRMLADKIKHYEDTGLKLNNTPAQYKDEFVWLKELSITRDFSHGLSCCDWRINQTMKLKASIK